MFSLLNLKSLLWLVGTFLLQLYFDNLSKIIKYIKTKWVDTLLKLGKLNNISLTATDKFLEPNKTLIYFANSLVRLPHM